jgi:hypothetical protein
LVGKREEEVVFGPKERIGVVVVVVGGRWWFRSHPSFHLLPGYDGRREVKITWVSKCVE